MNNMECYNGSTEEEERRNNYINTKTLTQEESERTLSTCPDTSEHSVSHEDHHEIDMNAQAGPSLLGEDFEEITVSSTDLVEFEERSIDTEDELSDDDEEDKAKDREWIANCEQYGYGNARPDIAEKNADRSQTHPNLNLHRRSSTDCVPPRRSSLKQGLGRRRASMCYGKEFDVNLPGRTKPIRRRSSITFNEEVEVAEVVPMKELTDNMEDLWLQSKDYARIRERSYDLVDLASQGMKYCTRGLEDLMEDKQQSKIECWDAVLDEQDEQRERGSFNEEAMARAYRLSSVESRVEANIRAKKDEKEVENYLRETRNFCRRLSM